MKTNIRFKHRALSLLLCLCMMLGTMPAWLSAVTPQAEAGSNTVTVRTYVEDSDVYTYNEKKYYFPATNDRKRLYNTPSNSNSTPVFDRIDLSHNWNWESNKQVSVCMDGFRYQTGVKGDYDNFTSGKSVYDVSSGMTHIGFYGWANPLSVGVGSPVDKVVILLDGEEIHLGGDVGSTPPFYAHNHGVTTSDGFNYNVVDTFVYDHQDLSNLMPCARRFNICFDFHTFYNFDNPDERKYYNHELYLILVTKSRYSFSINHMFSGAADRPIILQTCKNPAPYIDRDTKTPYRVSGVNVCNVNGDYTGSDTGFDLAFKKENNIDIPYMIKPDGAKPVSYDSTQRQYYYTSEATVSSTFTNDSFTYDASSDTYSFSYTATFKYDGQNTSTALDQTPQVQIYQNGSTGALLTPNPETSNAGTYTFSGSLSRINTDGSDTFTAKLILEGKEFDTLYWSPTKYTIKYKSEGFNDTTQKYYQATDLTLNPPALDRTGYTFRKWQVATAGGSWEKGTEYDESKYIGDGMTGNPILTAVWTPVEYTITFDPNGGSDVDGDNKLEYTIESTQNLPIPTRNGYTFLGWDVVISDGNWESGVTYADNGTAFPVKGMHGNVTLKACWDVEKSNVTFDENGGSPEAKDFVDYTVGTTITMPSITKDGYDFKGWKVIKVNGSPDANYTYGGWTVGETYNAEQTISGKYGAVTLQAQWTPVQYTVTFKYEDGRDKNEDNESSGTYSIESQISLPENMHKYGYQFVEWKVTTASGNWTEGETFDTAPAAGKWGDITLTAVWRKHGVSITYIADGNGQVKTPAGNTYEHVENVEVENGQMQSGGCTPVAGKNARFVGWYYKDGENNYKPVIIGRTPVNENGNKIKGVSGWIDTDGTFYPDVYHTEDANVTESFTFYALFDSDIYTVTIINATDNSDLTVTIPDRKTPMKDSAGEKIEDVTVKKGESKKIEIYLGDCELAVTATEVQNSTEPEANEASAVIESDVTAIIAYQPSTKVYALPIDTRYSQRNGSLL